MYVCICMYVFMYVCMYVCMYVYGPLLLVDQTSRCGPRQAPLQVAWLYGAVASPYPGPPCRLRTQRNNSSLMVSSVQARANMFLHFRSYSARFK